MSIWMCRRFYAQGCVMYITALQHAPSAASREKILHYLITSVQEVIEEC